mmetsp:Transcript_26237/g.40242  ORF Transcript_26237/g.40242 Transcript_26237/m.40242 type:complete len:136 (+) Transcript_26237:2164-2571(+)
MLTFFKINSEQQLEWNNDPQDPDVFIVIIATVDHEFSISTYLLCNKKQQSVVTSKYGVSGLSTIKVISQFDIKTETGVTSLDRGMAIIGLNALRVFLNVNRKRPFLYADLQRVLEAADVHGQEETSDLEYPNLSP